MDILNLTKSVVENGFTNNGNGTDTKIIALLNSLARHPDNAWHRRLLQRIVAPEEIRKALLGNPFEPYLSQEEFEGDMNIGLVGIHEPYTRQVLMLYGK